MRGRRVPKFEDHQKRRRPTSGCRWRARRKMASWRNSIVLSIAIPADTFTRPRKGLLSFSSNPTEFDTPDKAPIVQWRRHRGPRRDRSFVALAALSTLITPAIDDARSKGKSQAEPVCLHECPSSVKSLIPPLQRFTGLSNWIHRASVDLSTVKKRRADQGNPLEAAVRWMDKRRQESFASHHPSFGKDPSPMSEILHANCTPNKYGRMRSCSCGHDGIPKARSGA